MIFFQFKFWITFYNNFPLCSQFPYVPVLGHDIVSASIEMGYPPTTDLNGDNVTGFTIAQTFNKSVTYYYITNTTKHFLNKKSSGSIE